MLKIVTKDQITGVRKEPLDKATLARAEEIIEAVRAEGETALRRYAVELDGWDGTGSLVLESAELNDFLARLPRPERELLERTAERITAFASLQKSVIHPVESTVPGGRAGQYAAPVQTAGCYAPGGRYPLPSSVLMTAATAKAAGVPEIVVASPRPAPVTLAAAAAAGAGLFLCCGGAHAVAAMAFGIGGIPRCDVIAGPGNRWVTAAKKLLSGLVGIDFLAGPSELTIIADQTADPRLAAADLLAQAEHDPDALPVLIAWDNSVIQAVQKELREQLKTLPSAATAERALAGGFAVQVKDLSEATDAANTLAPEHLELMIAQPDRALALLKHYGAVFLGSLTAEVFGDYGAGPNHVLPTSSASRFTGGLSVLNFLRVRTWLHIDDSEQAAELMEDCAALARLEGLEAHARAAERRRGLKSR